MPDSTELDESWLEWGSGGVVSTLREQIIFLTDLLAGSEGQLISDNSLKLMHDFLSMDGPAADSDAPIGSSYGFGLIRERRDGYTLIGHGGMFNGFTAGLWYVPTDDGPPLIVALIANRGLIEKYPIYDALIPELLR